MDDASVVICRGIIVQGIERNTRNGVGVPLFVRIVGMS